MNYQDFLPAGKSDLEIIALALGTLGGLYFIFKGIQFIFGKPNIKVHIADTVDLVIGQDGLVNSFHLGCAFENRGSKIGVVQYMDAIVVDPNGNEENFK